jgi:uncharacterized membrane protein
MAKDQAATRSWIILGILIVVFIVGLIMVSLWGGPFESDAWWNQDAPPTFPN